MDSSTSIALVVGDLFNLTTKELVFGREHGAILLRQRVEDLCFCL